MRGKKAIPRRVIRPDEEYGSPLVAKFINHVMRGGKKETATKLVRQALAKLEEATHRPALEAFETAVTAAAPHVEVRSRRIGGATYQVPLELRPDRRLTLAMGWIIGAARKRQGKSMDRFLFEELLDSYNNTGTAVKQRDDLHKMAEANKAFAHFGRF